MKYKLTDGSIMVIQELEYKGGDTVTLTEEAAEPHLAAGILEEFKESKKESK